MQSWFFSWLGTAVLLIGTALQAGQHFKQSPLVWVHWQRLDGEGFARDVAALRGKGRLGELKAARDARNKDLDTRAAGVTACGWYALAIGAFLAMAGASLAVGNDVTSGLVVAAPPSLAGLYSFLYGFRWSSYPTEAMTTAGQQIPRSAKLLKMLPLLG